jgi:ribosome-associated translation inhibitor RaiA
VGDPLLPLPDGVYNLKYTIAPAYKNYVEKSIMRVEKLQEKFDDAFMKLDMMECDRAIKTQQKVDLNTIYFFIQGAIAAANNCAITEANKLYVQADKMLTNFIKNGCQCSGTNYVTNFY